MTAAPTLATDRLTLRAFTLDDFEPSLAIWQEEPVYRHITGAPMDRATRWEKFQRGPALWALLGYGFWAVEERGSRAYLGEIGFGEFARAIDPPLPDMPEMGWVFGSAAHGRGIASEALAAVLAWGDAAMPGPCQCIIAPDNLPSRNLAARHGFVEQRRALFMGEPTIVLERAEQRADTTPTGRAGLQ